MTSYLPSSLQRILPTLPTLTLATVYTSVAYNYAVQSRITKESERLHTLRLTALDELKEFYHYHLIPRQQTQDERHSDQMRAEEDELIRDLLRLGLDPASIGISDSSSAPAPALAQEDPSSSSSSSTTDYSKRRTTAWSDVLWGGPNSSTAASSPTSSSADIMEKATASARKTIANLSLFGSRDAQAGGDGGAMAAVTEAETEEELALQRWLAEVEANEAKNITPAAAAAAPESSPPAPLSAAPPRDEQLLPSRDPSLSKRRPEYLTTSLSRNSEMGDAKESPRPYRRSALI
ncbi:hypothetical protein OC846_003118 [Tilletia horrida]|uniref:Uncharacterized protein n=1 Tax=Tilletia horrida TaxID=155126 RepID=A0AAN6GT11_9BASI|nr:hypothetical protein OC846_003118 [Tilletia horrida]